jgi:hypothetical protein
VFLLLSLQHTWASFVVANVCGKDESEHATLEQENIDSCIGYIADLTRPCFIGHFWPLNAMQALPILNMSVSDTNKVRKALLTSAIIVPKPSDRPVTTIEKIQLTKWHLLSGLPDTLRSVRPAARGRIAPRS